MWAALIPIITQILGKNSPGLQKINSVMALANTIKTDKSVK